MALRTGQDTRPFSYAPVLPFFIRVRCEVGQPGLLLALVGVVFHYCARYEVTKHTEEFRINVRQTFFQGVIL